MKHTLFFFIACLLTFSLQAQAPKKFNYQGVARDSAGMPFKLKPIGLRLSILAGGSTGPVQYSETRSVLTNSYGLFTVAIGDSAGRISMTNTMDSVTWASGDKYLKVEIDPSLSGSYSTLGATQLLSVPYAMYAGNTATTPVPVSGLLTSYNYVSGLGNATGTSSMLFISNPATVTITSAGQKVFVSANQAMEFDRPTWTSGVASLYIGYAPSTSSTPTATNGGTAIQTFTEGIFTLSGVISGLAPGTYKVGIVAYQVGIYGYKATNGNVTAFVFN